MQQSYKLKQTLLHLRSWMVLRDHGLQIVFVDVGIYLRSRDALMSEHVLYRTQVRPSLDKVRGEAMPERMWTDLFL